MKKIVLVGYMGSGKSTIGALLAKQFEIPFYDLDNLIALAASKSINQIFKEDGEIYFRKLEQQIFIKYLSIEQPFVLGLGGGTPCYSNNHQYLKNPDIISIYLKANVQTLVQRLENQLQDRPLLNGLSGDGLYSYIATQVFERSYFYNQCHFNVSVDSKSTAQVISDIINLL